MKCMADSMKNEHRDLGSERVNVNFRVLEKTWKFVSEKGYEPWSDLGCTFSHLNDGDHVRVLLCPILGLFLYSVF